VTCIATTPYHLITGSDDSNILVWEVARLLELDTTVEHEPEQTLSNHRAAITSLVVGQSTNPDTNICVSASRDKSCIIWNYQTGVALRTLLLPSCPLSLGLDPCARAFYVSTEDCSMIAVELFAEKALLGAQNAEGSSTVVQVAPPFGTSSQEAGPASCLGLSYDGTVLLSGHANGQILRWDLSTRAVATEVANLNASVTNIFFVPPFASASRTQAASVVKPFLGSRNYTFAAQLSGDLVDESPFGNLVNTKGITQEKLEQAILSLHQPQTGTAAATDDELRKENENLWAIINEQRALQKKTLQRYVEAKSAAP
jgi:pre-rRNA-processing protein IPI3